jgi:phosphohistidine phosphatase SixA
MKGMRFDFIAVSPYWRARNTILPFMKENGYKGEIWPELTEEIDSGMNLPAGSLPYTSADLFNGSRINIPDDEKPYFKLRHDGTRNLKFGRTPPQNAADNRAAIATAIGRIVGIYGGTNKSVLLVGHTVAGQQFLKVLVHNEHIFDRGSRYESGIGNTQMWMAEQQPNGSFKVMILNDKPYTPDADVKSEK